MPDLFGLQPDQLGAQLRAAVGGGFDPSSIQSSPSPSPSPAPTGGLGSLLPASNAKYVEQDGKHKGVAGTARDILGFLGDFLLTRLHMGPMYQQAQIKRKEQAALEGFGADPQSTADALSRLSSIDPSRADKMRDTWIDNQRLAQNAASIQDARTARVEDLQAKAAEKKRLITAQGLNTLTNLKSDDERKAQYPALRAMLVKNNPAMESELSPEYDSLAVDTILNSAVPLGLQRGQVLTKNKIDNSEADAVRNEAGRNSRFDKGEDGKDRRLGVTEGGKNNRLGITEGGKDRRQGVAEAGKNNRQAAGIAARPKPKANPSAAEIIALRNNPEAAPYFDQKYGLGSSKKVLGK